VSFGEAPHPTPLHRAPRSPTIPLVGAPVAGALGPATPTPSMELHVDAGVGAVAVLPSVEGAGAAAPPAPATASAASGDDGLPSSGHTFPARPSRTPGSFAEGFEGPEKVRILSLCACAWLAVGPLVAPPPCGRGGLGHPRER
jgi:hypothetical protein